MSSIIHLKRRLVFPTWRKYKDALLRGELDPISRSKEINYTIKFDKDFSEQTVKKWNKNKSIGLAADILNFSEMYKLSNSKIAIEASEYILKNKELAGYSLANLASNILNRTTSGVFYDTSFRPSPFPTNDILFAEIAKFKKMVVREPRFAVGWIELARRYVLLAQVSKAEDCINKAIFSAPNNRYVLRSAARFYIHKGDSGQAFDSLVKSPKASSDPWILASILALSMEIEKITNHYNKGLKLINDKQFDPYDISELSSSMATLDLFNGKFKSSRRLFEQSLKRPNDNSLAQVFWNNSISNSRKSEVIEKEPYAYEARTVQQYKLKLIEESLQQNVEWINDEPFSNRPFILASYNSLTFLEDFTRAEEIAMLGLKSNPDDKFLKNNLAYALIMQNKTDEASKVLNSIPISDSTFSSVATQGLLNFRRGNLEDGRKLYKSVIDETNKRNLDYLETLAYANYVREEILAKSQHLPSLMLELKNKCSKRDEPDIKHIYERAVELYNQTTNLSFVK